MEITATKAVYNRKTKTYDVNVRRNANVLLAHEGFLVFSDAKIAKEKIESGTLVQHWDERKRAAVLAWLKNEITNL